MLLRIGRSIAKGDCACQLAGVVADSRSLLARTFKVFCAFDPKKGQVLIDKQIDQESERF